MSAWTWALLTVWLAAMCAAAAAFARVVRSLKALRNLYFYKAFDSTLNTEVKDRNTGTLWPACRRVVSEAGCCCYADMQFEMPPALHCLLLFTYFSTLLVSAYVADILSPTEWFSPLEAVLVAMCGSAGGITVTMAVEAVFVRSLNCRNEATGSYQETAAVNTAQADNDFAGLNRTNVMLEDIELREKLRKFPTIPHQTPVPEFKFSSEKISVEATLLTLVIAVYIAALWGIYEMGRVESRSCVLHWIFGVVVDIPIRLLVALILSMCKLLPNYPRRYQRLSYQITPSDLSSFLNIPRSPDPPYSPPPPSLLSRHEEEDSEQFSLFPSLSAVQPTQRVHHSRSEQETMQTIENLPCDKTDETEVVEDCNQPVTEVLETTEEKAQFPAPQIIEETIRSVPEESEIHTIVSTEQFPAPQIIEETTRSVPEESEIHTIVSTERSSQPVTERDPMFPGTAAIARISTASEECPSVLAPSEPRSRDSVSDEFPFPPALERYSDIEDSQADASDDLQSTAVPSIPETRPNRRADAQMLTGQKLVKPGYFANGQPIQTLRQSRRKGRRSRAPLESITSENEEDFDDLSRSKSLIALKRLRANSPEAAESTRYQTPASPHILHPEEYVRIYPEPLLQETIPPLLGDEISLRIDSPAAADETQISFMSSESSDMTVTIGRSSLPSILDKGKRRKKHKQKQQSRGRVFEVYDSPYQEILWRRIEAESGERKKSRGRMTKHVSLSPIAQERTLAKVVSREILRPPRPWY